MKLKSAYDDFESASKETGLFCPEESLAVQDALEESDINTIVRRFGLTGQLPENVSTPQYGDYTGITDYQSALNTVIAAQESFLEMPGDVRARFHNDPQEFLEFFSDDKNRDEARKLGLLVPEAVVPEPVAVRVIADAPVK